MSPTTEATTTAGEASSSSDDPESNVPVTSMAEAAAIVARCLEDDDDEPWRISVKVVGTGIDIKSLTKEHQDGGRMKMIDEEVEDDEEEGLGNGNNSNINNNNNNTSALPSESMNSYGERQFPVVVYPNDPLETLYEKIQSRTGLTVQQQRIIYRGRLIAQPKVHSQSSASTSSLSSSSSSSSPSSMDVSTKQEQQQMQQNTSTSTTDSSDSRSKIKDIDGLSDGQTIHLLKRQGVEETSSRDDAAEEGEGIPENGNSTNIGRPRAASTSTEREALNSATSGSGLLAALLGLTNTPLESPSNNNSNNSNGNNSDGTARRLERLRNTRSSRRPHYRMSREDRQVPDPGSMEPVRQGLMTLHTLLPHLTSTSSDLPSNNQRQWYRGQWLDCLDTVNQWLEATVVEIIQPQHILPEAYDMSTQTDDCRAHSRVENSTEERSPTDPAISASDMEGRRRLLLEPCDPSDPHSLGDSLVGYRPRSNNVGVQLLLIHYNGWPHRWDEWIRSDSERLRPFRTRTRHPDVSSTAGPTTQSVFHEAPRTNIVPGDEEDDRMALLPELARAVASVHTLLQDQLHNQDAASSQRQPPSFFQVADEQRRRRVSQSNRDDLPWMSFPVTMPQEASYGQEEEAHSESLAAESPISSSNPATDQTNTSPPQQMETGVESTSKADGKSANEEEEVKNHTHANNDIEATTGTSSSHGCPFVYDSNSDSSSVPPPLLDRDGLDNSDDSSSSSDISSRPNLERRESDRRLLASRSNPNGQMTRRSVENLATLFDRLGRTLTDAAPHLAYMASSLPSAGSSMEQDQEENLDQSPMMEATVEQAIEEIAESILTSPSSDAIAMPSGEIVSLWSRPDENSNDTEADSPQAASRTHDVQTQRIDADLEDFASGLVNTTRGEVRNGPRSRSNNSNEEVASALGAYLTAASLGNGGGDGNGLGQLLRGGGTEGGGIDIHIHAVVTGPGGANAIAVGGGDTGTGGLGALTGGTTGALPVATRIGGTRNIFSSAANARGTNGNSILRGSRTGSGRFRGTRRRNHSYDAEDAGIFDELYSETPTPINPNLASPSLDTSIRLTNDEGDEDNNEDDREDYITGLNASYRSTGSFGGSNFRREMDPAADMFARPRQLPSRNERSSAATASFSTRGISSTRRRSIRRSRRRDTSDESNEPPRRRLSGLGRLFRRRSSRTEPEESGEQQSPE